MKSLFALAFVLGAIGCAKDITADVEKLADRACACKDATCGNQVLDDLVALAKAHPKASGDKDKTAAAAKRLGECVVTAGVPLSDFMAKANQL